MHAECPSTFLHTSKIENQNNDNCDRNKNDNVDTVKSANNSNEFIKFWQQQQKQFERNNVTKQ